MKNNSISLKLSLKYMGLVAIITILICSVFFGAHFLYIKSIRSDTLNDASEKIIDAIKNDQINQLEYMDLPYYIIFCVYDTDSHKIAATNDNLLPQLNTPEGKVTEFFEKNFYFDSDLKIAVLNKTIQHKDSNLTVECAMDIENDSLSKMVNGFPKVLLICLLPILALSFYISYLISRKTIKSFKKLESAFEKEKSFTANVSHELKTPVAIIDGHANLLKRWGKDNPQQLDESVNVILEETQNISSIIQTLLDLSKIENGIIQVQLSEFFISNLFASLRDEFKMVHSQVEFKIEDDDYIKINSDEKILHQVLTAIIANSIKFAGETCRIILRCFKNGSRTIIEVQDNGPGFEPEKLPYIFERFYKGDKSHTRNGSGAGLGLAIAKALCQSINAEISASNADESGALITISCKI